MASGIRRFFENLFADIIAQGLWVWLKGTVIVTILVAVWEWLQGRSPLEIILLAALIVFVLVGLLEIIAKRRARSAARQNVEAKADDVVTEADVLSEKIIQGIQLFSDRGELNQARSLSEQLAKASHVHAFWTTGAKAFDEGKELHRIKRLILPNPDGDYLECYRASYESATDLGNSIRAVTKNAKSRGILVKWYDDFIGYSLMIGDADMNHGWVQIEMAFPCMPKGDHPSITIEKAAYPKIIANLALMFDRL